MFESLLALPQESCGVTGSDCAVCVFDEGFNGFDFTVEEVVYSSSQAR